jgi:tetratricopeptide (TPR) repeat protein
MILLAVAVLVPVLLVVTCFGLVGWEFVPRTTTIIDLDCGTVKLRFQEKSHPEPLGGLYNRDSSWEDFLLLRRSGDWVELSRGQGSTRGAGNSIAAEGPDVPYARLLPPELGFHDFPLSEGRVTSSRFASWRWPLFIDPAVVTRGEYDAISSCLAKNLGAVDRAFVANDGGPRPYVTSIVYAAFDRELTGCGAKTVGVRWSCGGGKAYIKTRPRGGPNGPLVLCVAGADMEVEMSLGDLSSDQNAVFLRDPEWSPTTRALLGEDPKAYYTTCRDASGKGFFDTFELGGDVPGRADALYNSGRHKEALEAYRERLARERPNDAADARSRAVAHRGAANCLMWLKRGEEATAEYRKAAELLPDDLDIQYWLGMSLLDGSDKEAVVRFQKVIALEPGNARGFIGLAAALYELNRYAAAVDAYDKAIKLCATCLDDNDRVAYEYAKEMK